MTRRQYEAALVRMAARLKKGEKRSNAEPRELSGWENVMYESQRGRKITLKKTRGEKK